MIVAILILAFFIGLIYLVATDLGRLINEELYEIGAGHSAVESKGVRSGRADGNADVSAAGTDILYRHDRQAVKPEAASPTGRAD